MRLPLVALMLLSPFIAHAAQRPRIEVAFVLDATGSMQPWIDAARQKIDAIATELAAGDPPPDVRFALVTYRDKGDAYVTRTRDFTRDLAAMRTWLTDTRADGGGDTPEAVLEGLKAGVVELSWSPDDGQSMKLLYLVGDAPPHHYKDSPTEAFIAAEALRRGIVLHTIACGSMDSAGQGFFEEMARRTEGRPFRLADSVPRRESTAAARARLAAHVSAAGATGTTSLGAAVSSSARAYSSALGIKYASTARPVTTAPLAVPSSSSSGLLGAQLRVVSDQTAWTDLWAAHTSVEERSSPPPAVDFSRFQVLVLGGADAGLELTRLEAGDGVRWATLRSSAPGVRFLVVPTDKTVIVAKGGAR
jgi:Mg-chelatase subunit ChlD